MHPENAFGVRTLRRERLPKRQTRLRIDFPSTIVGVIEMVSAVVLAAGRAESMGEQEVLLPLQRQAGAATGPRGRARIQGPGSRLRRAAIWHRRGGTSRSKMNV